MEIYSDLFFYFQLKKGEKILKKTKNKKKPTQKPNKNKAQKHVYG